MNRLDTQKIHERLSHTPKHHSVEIKRKISNVLVLTPMWRSFSPVWTHFHHVGFYIISTDHFHYIISRELGMKVGICWDWNRKYLKFVEWQTNQRTVGFVRFRWEPNCCITLTHIMQSCVLCRLALGCIWTQLIDRSSRTCRKFNSFYQFALGWSILNG